MDDSLAQPEVFYLPAAAGEQRLCLFHRPAGQPRGRVLFLHPFAEEMNKSRRMAALGARALAAAGHAVLQIDLRGCGDSSADFGDASWQDWIVDVDLGLRWLDTHAGEAPLWLWGLRAGCLLAVDAATALNRSCNFLFWQPTPSGPLVLQQFMRLRLAAEMAGGGSKGLMDAMKAELAAGRAVEVAGYALHPALAAGLESTRLAPAAGTGAGRLVWRERGNREDGTLSPASQRALEAWREAGWQVDAGLAPGPGFWSTSEIEIAPALITQTVEAL